MPRNEDALRGETRIALFRGINVGGKHALPMKQLRAFLEGLGLRDVRTYIQSGNVVFRGGEGSKSALCRRIVAAIATDYDFEPEVLVLELDDLRRAVASNPFPEAESEPSRLHAYFLSAAPPDPDVEGLEGLRKDSERFHLDGPVFYLHAPDGVGRSRLAARAERLLGVTATARNWRTVQAVLEMASAVE